MTVREWLGTLALAFVGFQVFALGAFLGVSWIVERQHERVLRSIPWEDLEVFLQAAAEEIHGEDEGY